MQNMASIKALLCLVLLSHFTLAAKLMPDKSLDDMLLAVQTDIDKPYSDFVETYFSDTHVDLSVLIRLAKDKSYIAKNAPSYLSVERLQTWFQILLIEASIYRHDFKVSWDVIEQLSREPLSDHVSARLACAKVALALSSRVLSESYRAEIDACQSDPEYTRWESVYIMSISSLANAALGIESEYIVLDNVRFISEYRGAVTHIAQSLILFFNGDQKSAISLMMQKFNKARTGNNLSLLFTAAQNYSILLGRDGQLSLALEVLRETIQKAEPKRYVRDKVNLQLIYGRLLRRAGKTEQSILVLEESMYSSLRNKLVHFVFIAARDLSSAYVDNGDNLKLTRTLDQTLNFVKRMAFYENVAPHRRSFEDLISLLEPYSIQHPIMEVQLETLLTKQKRKAQNRRSTGSPRA
jgi:hypothetical protein